MSLRPRAPTLERDGGHARETALDWLKTKRERCMSVIVGEDARKRLALRMMRGDRPDMANRAVERLVDDDDFAQEGGMRRSSPVVSMARFPFMPGAMSTASCFTQLTSTDRKRVRYARQWNVQLIGVDAGLCDGAADKSHSNLLGLVGRCKSGASKMCRLGEAHHLLISPQWLYVTDTHRKVLYARHELQDITSVASLLDDNRHLLVLKAWQPPGLRFTCLVFACSSEDMIQDICRQLQGKFAKFSHIVAMSKHRRLCHSTPNLADLDDALDESAEERSVTPTDDNLVVFGQDEEECTAADAVQAFPFDEGYESHQSSSSPSCAEARSVSSNLSPHHPPARQWSTSDRLSDRKVGEKADGLDAGARFQGRMKWKGFRDKMKNAIFSKTDKSSSTSVSGMLPQKGKKRLDISGPTLVDPPAVITGHAMKLPWSQDGAMPVCELLSVMRCSPDQPSSPVHLYDCVSEEPEVAFDPAVLAMSNPLASSLQSQDSLLLLPPPKPPRANAVAQSGHVSKAPTTTAKTCHGRRRNSRPDPLFSPPGTPPPPPENEQCPLYDVIGQPSPCPSKPKTCPVSPPPLPARPKSTSPPLQARSNSTAAQSSNTSVPPPVRSNSSPSISPLAVMPKSTSSLLSAQPSSSLPQIVAVHSSSPSNDGRSSLCSPQLITNDIDGNCFDEDEAPPVPPRPAEHLLLSMESLPQSDEAENVSAELSAASLDEKPVDRHRETIVVTETSFSPTMGKPPKQDVELSKDQATIVCVPSEVTEDDRSNKVYRSSKPGVLPPVSSPPCDVSSTSEEPSPQNSREDCINSACNSPLQAAEEKVDTQPKTNGGSEHQPSPGHMLQQLLSTSSGREELLAFAKELLPLLTALHGASTPNAQLNAQPLSHKHTAESLRTSQEQERSQSAAHLSSMPIRTAKRQSLKRQAALQSTKHSAGKKSSHPPVSQHRFNRNVSQKKIPVYKVRGLLSTRSGRRRLREKSQANTRRRKSTGILTLEEKSRKHASQQQTLRSSSAPLLNMLAAAQSLRRSSNSKAQMLLI